MRLRRRTPMSPTRTAARQRQASKGAGRTRQSYSARGRRPAAFQRAAERAYQIAAAPVRTIQLVPKNRTQAAGRRSLALARALDGCSETCVDLSALVRWCCGGGRAGAGAWRRAGDALAPACGSGRAPTTHCRTTCTTRGRYAKGRRAPRCPALSRQVETMVARTEASCARRDRSDCAASRKCETPTTAARRRGGAHLAARGVRTAPARPSRFGLCSRGARASGRMSAAPQRATGADGAGGPPPCSGWRDRAWGSQNYE